MALRRSGTADLRLHGGYAPQWLTSRMIRLARAIFTIMVEEFSISDILARLSDPFFFQACSNVLGFDWDSSGSTTVTCGVLKNVFCESNLGIKAAGGKGARSREALKQIGVEGFKLGLSAENVESLRYSSRMSAKVDSAAIQDSYQIYHHMMFFSEGGQWTVVQQGMNADEKTARRYHWLSSRIRSFVEEPHTGIVGEKLHSSVLDMTAKESSESRATCVDLSKENPRRVERLYRSIRHPSQQSLARWVEAKLGHEYVTHYKATPRRLDWEALRRTYEFQPSNYEQFLAVKGVGPATVRGLALIAELIYGKPPSWRDPVKYSFAFGGKDGVPFPVDRKAMDESISMLRQSIEGSKLGGSEKNFALEKLRRYVPADLTS